VPRVPVTTAYAIARPKSKSSSQARGLGASVLRRSTVCGHGGARSRSGDETTTHNLSNSGENAPNSDRFACTGMKALVARCNCRFSGANQNINHLAGKPKSRGRGDCAYSFPMHAASPSQSEPAPISDYRIGTSVHEAPASQLSWSNMPVHSDPTSRCASTWSRNDLRYTIATNTKADTSVICPRSIAPDEFVFGFARAHFSQPSRRLNSTRHRIIASDDSA